MRPVLDREQSWSIDRSIAARGVPALLLMENAGRGAADWISEHTDWSKGEALVLCGPGNNGGDGWVVARRLLALGRPVRVLSYLDPASLSADAAVMFQAFVACAGNWQRWDGESSQLSAAALLVDALWGTGLNRDLDMTACALIQALNEGGTPVVSLDVPSGLDANTGQVRGACIRARATLVFASDKLGLLTPNGHEFAGEQCLLDIGVPAELSVFDASLRPAAFRLEESDIVGWVKQRRSPRHKGEAGRVVVIAGSPGSSGAARLTAHAALRAGAGLVTLAVRADTAAELRSSLWETMLCCIDPDRVMESLAPLLESADCVALGPGLGLDATGERITREVIANCHSKLVLDADALTHCARLGAAPLLKASPAQLMLTPHPGEAGRLLGRDSRAVEADRFDAVKRLSDFCGGSVLLKGRPTLLGDPGAAPWVVARGASTLATAGSGDVLTGVTAALACHLSPREALAAAAWLHALAGECAAEQRPSGVLAREFADLIPTLLRELRLGAA